MPLIPIKFDPGFYTEQTPSGAVNRWKDGDQVRFRYLLPEKMRGRRQLPGQFVGMSRALHDWVSLDNKKWVAIGTSRKLFLYHDEVYYDITPFKAGSVAPFTDPPLTNPFTTVNGSDIVTVTDTQTPVGVGDAVHFSGATAVGGLLIDGEYEVLSVPTPGEYTIQANANATSSATGGGTVQWEYEISVSNLQFGGWSSGVWSGGVWSGAQSTSEVDRIRLWSLESWGEDLLANPRDGAIYWWDRTLGPQTRAVLIPNAPRKVRRIILSPQDRHLIAIGADDPLDTQWCSQEDFNEWTPLEFNTAGDKRLDMGGSEMITGVRTRSEIVLFGDEAVMAMGYDGPPLVFGFVERGESLTIISPNAMSEINGIVYFMTVTDFMMYDGLLRVLPCAVRNHVYDRLNRAHEEKVYASVNRMNNEIWWYYPTGSSEEPNEYVCYNYMEECWYYGILDRTSMHDMSAAFSLPYASDHDGHLWLHEIGVDDCRLETIASSWGPLTSVGAIPAGDWASIAWSDGEYAALSSNNLDSPAQIMCSADGISWTTHAATDVQGRNWRAVTGVTGVPGISYIAVASNETLTTNLAASSPDCVSWAPNAVPPAARLADVLYESGRGIFVASGGNSSAPEPCRPHVSVDGTSWALTTPTFDMESEGIAYSPALDIFVIVGKQMLSSGIRVIYSTDGYNWNPVVTVPTQLSSVAWIPAPHNYFLAAGFAFLVPLYRSFDGITWTAFGSVGSTSSSGRTVMLVIPSTGRVIWTSAAANRIWYSDDGGGTWTEVTVGSVGWHNIAYSPSLDRLVAINSTDGTSTSNRIAYSDNQGVSWTVISGSYPSIGRGHGGVIWVEELGLFVARCSTTSIYSSDGINWSSAGGAVATRGSMAWAADKGMLVSVITSPSVPSYRVFNSLTGESWHQVTPISNSAWRNVLFSPEQMRVVAVASSSADRVAFSPPTSGIYTVGQSWEMTAAHAQEWYGLAYSPSLDLWVATSITGTGQRVMTSPTGITWTLRNTPEDNEWRSVAWSEPLGMFAAVASSGTNRIMTSSDGLAWAAVAAPAASGWDKIIWAQDRFWATASVGAGGERVMYSEDGATWLLLAADPEVDGWLALTYSDTLDEVTFVGSAGAMQSEFDPEHEVTVCDPIPSRLESYDAQIGEGDEFMHASKMIPDFLRLEGSIDITIRSKSYPADEFYNVKGPYTVDATDRMVDIRIRGRQLTIEFQTDALGDDWRFGTFRVDAIPHGRRGGRARGS